MAEPTSSMSFAAISGLVATYAKVDSGTAIAHTQAGLRAFYRAFNWSFTCPATTLTVATGDITTALPDDFAEMVDPFAYAANQGFRTVEQTNTSHLLQLSSDSLENGYPLLFAIEPAAFTAATGQRWVVRWWPKPQQAFVFTYRYRRVMPLVSTTDFIPGGPEHSSTILYLALADYEQMSGRAGGQWTQLADRELAKSIAIDQANRSGVVLGSMVPSKRIDLLKINPITEV